MRWLLAVSLACCATPTHWIHRVGEANFDADTYECERDNRMIGSGRYGPNKQLDWDLYVKCMRVKGWTQTD